MSIQISFLIEFSEIEATFAGKK